MRSGVVVLAHRGIVRWLAGAVLVAVPVTGSRCNVAAAISGWRSRPASCPWRWL
jgi:hypothetical protein